MSTVRRTRFTGEEGRARVEAEVRKQKEASEARKNQVHMPFRFRVSPGEEAEICILDESPNFFRYEHNLMGPDGKYNVFTGCTSEFENCPVCETLGKDSTYTMYLTVIDFTTYTDSKGREVQWSRKLLPVKPAQQKKFMRYHEKLGNLRGAVFKMIRDGERDPAIGNDIEFLDEWVEEEDLATYNRSYKDREGKQHTEDCSQPYDYDKLFPEQTSDELRRIVGGKPAAGSREQARDTLREDAPRGRSSRSTSDAGTTQTRPPSRRAAPKEEEEERYENADDNLPWDADDDMTPEEKPSEKPAERAKLPARRVARGGERQAPKEEPESPSTSQAGARTLRRTR